jgi:hypothetical protein
MHFVLNHGQRFGISPGRNYSPGIEDILAFMGYRIAYPIEGDKFSAAISLKTFDRAELNMLVRAHRMTFPGFSVNVDDVRNSIEYGSVNRLIRRGLGDSVPPHHAKIIWFEDERRLISANSRCTNGFYIDSFHQKLEFKETIVFLKNRHIQRISHLPCRCRKQTCFEEMIFEAQRENGTGDGINLRTKSRLHHLLQFVNSKSC